MPTCTGQQPGQLDSLTGLKQNNKHIHTYGECIQTFLFTLLILDCEGKLEHLDETARKWNMQTMLTTLLKDNTSLILTNLNATHMG